MIGSRYEKPVEWVVAVVSALGAGSEDECAKFGHSTASDTPKFAHESNRAEWWAAVNSNRWRSPSGLSASVRPSGRQGCSVGKVRAGRPWDRSASGSARARGRISRKEAARSTKRCGAGRR